MDKVKLLKPNPKYRVEGVSRKGSIGHATQVFPVQANAGQDDVSRIKFRKRSYEGYDPKAYK